MTRKLTVVEIADWSALFDDESLVNEGYSMSIGDLVRASRGEPVTIAVVYADGTELDRVVCDLGSFPERPLPDILALARR